MAGDVGGPDIKNGKSTLILLAAIGTIFVGSLDAEMMNAEVVAASGASKASKVKSTGGGNVYAVDLGNGLNGFLVVDLLVVGIVGSTSGAVCSSCWMDIPRIRNSEESMSIDERLRQCSVIVIVIVDQQSMTQ